ncbi:hypothetical protein ABPG74_004210 [Tetrahymena malaccensis]
MLFINILARSKQNTFISTQKNAYINVDRMNLVRYTKSSNQVRIKYVFLMENAQVSMHSYINQASKQVINQLVQQGTQFVSVTSKSNSQFIRYTKPSSINQSPTHYFLYIYVLLPSQSLTFLERHYKKVDKKAISQFIKIYKTNYFINHQTYYKSSSCFSSKTSPLCLSNYIQKINKQIKFILFLYRAVQNFCLYCFSEVACIGFINSSEKIESGYKCLGVLISDHPSFLILMCAQYYQKNNKKVIFFKLVISENYQSINHYIEHLLTVFTDKDIFFFTKNLQQAKNYDEQEKYKCQLKILSAQRIIIFF